VVGVGVVVAAVVCRCVCVDGWFVYVCVAPGGIALVAAHLVR
jgi:hypothetical protein